MNKHRYSWYITPWYVKKGINNLITTVMISPPWPFFIPATSHMHTYTFTTIINISTLSTSSLSVSLSLFRSFPLIRTKNQYNFIVHSN